MATTDEHFFDRADEHINVSNDQMEHASEGKVSASMMYATARFNAWLSATGYDNAKDMKETKEETVAYFVAEYEKMLRENLEDYIQNFDAYMRF
jgi:PPE-repeat protein